MGSDAVAQNGTFKGYGLVRNAQGQPQFDDYNNIPEVFHPILTEQDWEYIKQQQEANHGNHSP